MLFGLLMAFSCPCSAMSQPLFTIIDIGTLGGKTSFAYGVNEQGAVAGKSETDNGDVKAFYWDAMSGMVDIGLGKALGLNKAGRVVGNIHHHNDDAFIWDSVNGLSFLNKGDFLFATASRVSNSGKVVGYARKFSDIEGTRAILWDPSADTLTILGTFGGPSYAFGINHLGEVVGNSGNPSRAFIWNNAEGMRDLGSLNEESWRYYATDVNDSGQVVGYARTVSDEYRAFMWEPGVGMTLLPGDNGSLAFGINSHGHVVGAKGTLIGLEGKAYLWKEGERIDLNQAIPVDSGWELREARGITDRGQICGSGLIGGEIHAFLLTPVPSVKADIKANGSDLPITVSPTDVVSITVTLDPSSDAGREADWWISVHTSFDSSLDWYTFVYGQGWQSGITPCLRGPLFTIAQPYEALSSPLPVGNYLFVFGVDSPDAAPSGPWWGLDTVAVEVQD
jgi:probable HAF family extracellular repeat protein